MRLRQRPCKHSRDRRHRRSRARRRGIGPGRPLRQRPGRLLCRTGEERPRTCQDRRCEPGRNRVLRIARLCVCGGNPLCASCCHEVREVAKPLSQSAIRQVGSPGSPGLPVYYAWDSGTTPGSPKHYVRRIRALRPENPCQRVGARSEARAASIVGDEALLPQTGILPVRRC